MEIRIPFNRPWISGNEVAYLTRAANSSHLSGDGPFTRQCHELLRDSFGQKQALLTTSCTDALEMCALLLDLKPGDEVILPSFTFVSTANSFVLHGARPVFADIDPQTLNIDPESIQRLITDRTRAVIVVHYAGVGCDMDEILQIATENGMVVIEDNAHGLGGSYRGRALGTFGTLATLSFHETKNFTAGEGGALIINDENLMSRAEIIREKGTDRSRFFRGQVDKYGWVDVGSSFLPSELVAAHLCAQLQAKDIIQTRRAAIWHRYEQRLAGWAGLNAVQLPRVPLDRGQSYHMFYMLMPSLDDRSRLIEHLKSHGILAVFHYLPLHQSVMAQHLGCQSNCPVTDDVSDRLVRLPFFTGLAQTEQDEVIDRVLEFKTTAFSGGQSGLRDSQHQANLA